MKGNVGVVLKKTIDLIFRKKASLNISFHDYFTTKCFAIWSYLAQAGPTSFMTNLFKSE